MDFKLRIFMLVVLPGILAYDPDDCVMDCSGRESGNYNSCKSCEGYVACVHGHLYEMPCPANLQYSSLLHRCEYTSDTCPAVCRSEPIGIGGAFGFSDEEAASANGKISGLTIFTNTIPFFGIQYFSGLQVSYGGVDADPHSVSRRYDEHEVTIPAGGSVIAVKVWQAVGSVIGFEVTTSDEVVHGPFGQTSSPIVQVNMKESSGLALEFIAGRVFPGVGQLQFFWKCKEDEA